MLLTFSDPFLAGLSMDDVSPYVLGQPCLPRPPLIIFKNMQTTPNMLDNYFKSIIRGVLGAWSWAGPQMFSEGLHMPRGPKQPLVLPVQCPGFLGFVSLGPLLLD